MAGVSQCSWSLNFNELGVRLNRDSIGETTGCPERGLLCLHHPVHTLAPQSCLELASCRSHWEELPRDCGLWAVSWPQEPHGATWSHLEPCPSAGWSSHSVLWQERVWGIPQFQGRHSPPSCVVGMPAQDTWPMLCPLDTPSWLISGSPIWFGNCLWESANGLYTST